MTTSAIRQKLVNYMEIADDKKVKAMYALFEDQIEETQLEYSNELKEMLDNRQTEYINGNTKIITSGESKKRINAILKAKHK